jgi:peptide/nickel transport system permease protein
MNWLFKRVGAALFTAWAALTVSFVLIRLLPGGPMDFMRAQLMSRGERGSQSSERVDAIVQAYTNIDPSKPLPQQYVEWFAAVLQGDLGQSIWHNEPVGLILYDALPWTVFVMGTSLVLTFVIGCGLGALMAYAEGSQFDYSSSAVFTLMNSVPYYIAGLLFVYFFAYNIPIFPPRGRVASGVELSDPVAFYWSVLYHGALPILSVVLTGFGGWAVSMRGNSISVLGTDYMRVGELRGIARRRLVLNYVGRNAILPLYTSLMIAIGFMFGGSVILERIFAYPGIGYYLVQAVNQRDYQLMMGAFILITLAVVIGIFIADITYNYIDPRLRSSEAE